MAKRQHSINVPLDKSDADALRALAGRLGGVPVAELARLGIRAVLTVAGRLGASPAYVDLARRLDDAHLELAHHIDDARQLRAGLVDVAALRRRLADAESTSVAALRGLREKEELAVALATQIAVDPAFAAKRVRGETRVRVLAAWQAAALAVGGPPAVADVARRAGISVQGARYHVNALERDGKIRRAPALRAAV